MIERHFLSNDHQGEPFLGLNQSDPQAASPKLGSLVSAVVNVACTLLPTTELPGDPEVFVI